MGLGCHPSKGDCSVAQLAYLDAYGATMRALVLDTVSRGGRHGAFLVSCDVHMLEAVDGAWAAIRVQNATLAETFKAWWGSDRGEIAVDKLWTQGDGVHGGNADCVNYGPVPSRPYYS